MEKVFKIKEGAAPVLFKDIKPTEVTGKAFISSSGSVSVITDIDILQTGDRYAVLSVRDIEGSLYCSLSALYPDTEIYEIEPIERMDNVIALIY